MSLIAFLEARSRPTLVVLTLLLLGAVGAADYLTGSEVVFSAFYALPICLMAWFASRKAGALTAGACAFADLLVWMVGSDHRDTLLIPFCNAVVHLAFFLLVAYTVSGLRQARGLQEQMTHFIIHDLRTPMTTIRGALHTCEDLCTPEREDDRDLVRNGLTALNQMMLMIDGLLEAARSESTQMPVHAREFPLNDTVQEALLALETYAGDHEVELEAQLPAQPLPVYADPDLILRVVTNLVSNAIKHSPTGARVTVHARGQEDGTVLVGVTDRGVGVPPELLKKVFDKFRQVQARRAGAAVGFGLGLTFCRLAVQAQGGRIWMESQPNVETTVYFSLPSP